jgi:hypothetical protein
MLLMLCASLAACGEADSPAPVPAAATAAPSPSPAPTPAPPIDLGDGITMRQTAPHGAHIPIPAGHEAVFPLDIRGADGSPIWQGTFAFLPASGQGSPALDRAVTAAGLGATIVVTAPAALLLPGGTTPGETLLEAHVGPIRSQPAPAEAP